MLPNKSPNQSLASTRVTTSLVQFVLNELGSYEKWVSFLLTQITYIVSNPQTNHTKNGTIRLIQIRAEKGGPICFRV